MMYDFCTPTNTPSLTHDFHLNVLFQGHGARLRLGPPFRWAHVLLGILQSAPYAVLAEEAVLPQPLLLLLLLPALLLLELVAGGRDAQLKLGVVQRGLDDEREAPL